VAITEGTQPTPVHATGLSATTASFTPEANTLLVALVAADGLSTVALSTAVSDSLSGSWTLLKRQNTITGVGGAAEVWIRDIGASPASMTVTANWNNAAGTNGGNLTVRTLIGALPVAQQTGATGGNGGSSVAPTCSLTPTQIGSRIYGAALDYTTNATLTANANTTSIDQFPDATNGDTWATFQASGDTSSLSSTSYGYTNANAAYNVAAAEILAAATAGDAPQPIVAPPVINRPWLRISWLPWQASNGADGAALEPASPDVPQQLLAQAYRGRRPTAVRRGRFFGNEAATVPSYIPALIEPASRTRKQMSRRGEFLLLPLDANGPTGTTSLVARRGRPAQPSRRGHFWTVPPAQIAVAGPGPLVTPLIRALPRRIPPLYRRGHVQPIPLVGAAPPAGPAFPPPFLEQTHTRPAASRRGRYLATPAAPPAAVPAPIGGHRRPAAPPRRRGTFARVVAVIGQPAPVLAGRRRPCPAARRGGFAFWSPPPPLAPPATPGPLFAKFLTRRRPVAQARPRRAFGGVLHACTITWPNAGTVARPNTGTVTYGGSTVARPDTGTVTRLDTGIVEDPC
jgi:hypothetical protein